MHPLLDIGCGNWPIPADVYGDIEVPDNIKNLIGKFVCCDVQNLPFFDQTFNFVHCSNILEHLPNPHKAFTELKRVSRHGYIECPSAFRENILCQTGAHQWVIKIVNGKILTNKPRQITLLGIKIFPTTWLYRLLSKKRILWKFVDFLLGDIFNILYVHYRW